MHFFLIVFFISDWINVFIGVEDVYYNPLQLEFTNISIKNMFLSALANLTLFVCKPLAMNIAWTLKQYIWDKKIYDASNRRRCFTFHKSCYVVWQDCQSES